MGSNDDLSPCLDLLCAQICCFQTNDSAWGNPKAPSASQRVRVSFLLTPLCPETEIIFNKSSLSSQIASEVLFEGESFALEKTHIKISNILQKQVGYYICYNKNIIIFKLYSLTNYKVFIILDFSA